MAMLEERQMQQEWAFAAQVGVEWKEEKDIFKKTFRSSITFGGDT